MPTVNGLVYASENSLKKKLEIKRFALNVQMCDLSHYENVKMDIKHEYY